MNYNYKIRLYVLATAFLCGFSLLIIQLWRIQVDQHEKWSKKVYGKSEINVRIPGVRGEIKDRNGNVLVTNEPNYEVVFNLRTMIEKYAEDNELPVYTREKIRHGVVQRKAVEVDIVEVVNKTVINRLIELNLAGFLNTNHLRTHYRTHRGLVPFVYRRDLSFEEFSKYAEHNIRLPGLEVRAKPSRKYIYGALASHILGYMQLFDDQKIPQEELKKFNHYVGDDFGIDGIEKTMESYLRALPGERVLEKDEKGNILSQKSFIAPSKGSDVFLTIDAKIQYITENAIRVIGQGSAVVIDITNGEILSMASVPSFNPNLFIPNISQVDWDNIVKDKTKPLVNRAIQPYNPGSAFKIPVALAGCNRFQNFANKYWQKCFGSTTYGKSIIRCWKKAGHGSINMVDAIKKSCNCFFYQASNSIGGIDQIKRISSLLGLGKKTGIKISAEESGKIPDTKWFKTRFPGQKWGKAYNAIASIGQGYVETTPLQMASMTAAVANDGVYYKPTIIKKISDKQTGEIIIKDKKFIDIKDYNIDLNSIKKIKLGMYKVVNESGGTARRANLKDFAINLAGKTGTAQTGRKRPDGKNETNAWFIAFAPYEKPKYAVAVFVKGGESGGKVASPIAKKIIRDTILMDRKKITFDVKELTPANGHSNPIAQVKEEKGLIADVVHFNEGKSTIVKSSNSFENDPAIALVENTSRIKISTLSKKKKKYAKPSIKKKPDKRNYKYRKKRSRKRKNIYKAKNYRSKTRVRRATPAKKEKRKFKLFPFW